MSRAKRTPGERERDLAVLSEMYVTGHSQEQMAKHFNLSRTQICYDLKQIRKRWVEEQVANFDAMKSVELQKLDRLEQEAWRAWENSLKPAEKKTVEEVMNKEWESIDEDTGEIVQPVEVRKKLQTIGSYGDPRFMEMIFRCIDRRCKIRGLDAPTKIAPTSPDGSEPYKLQVERLQELSTQELELLDKLQRQQATNRVAISPPSQN